jgi:chemotaxis protein CheZ
VQGTWGAGVQRKIFRVEQMFGKPRAQAFAARDADKPQAGQGDQGDQAGLARELALIRETIGRNKRELLALQGSGKDQRLARAADELSAAVNGMEKATQKILKSTEAIDESAKTLTATLKTGYERGLARDIQDQTMRIYEACNFQDLAGQRIGKAIAALNAVEEHVARMIALWENLGHPPQPADANHSSGRHLVSGPKLDGDTGHANQRDIDKMFG